ncbi:coA binding domain-containing protein [Hirsutella rhossiliensis]|uniref:CoA binding domain-containing protein n=1 Tax=Hirsutella rhossiliensis TaxID=111463 RepID=A0A9P8N489_9HYPO|nr:coA binding domain-containing protein [Hirsutella rhossiliensis]KAH0966662.1 coA binding domain-containing protein [Hirsutella rhossiliensis]
MATEATARKFFASPLFAVVGASSNPAKFGHKVPNLSALPNPRQTSVSIITPPGATLGVLEEAKKLGIPAVWMQPGTFDEAVLEFALAEGAFESVVYGDGGRGSEGWCVLVDGEKALKDAGKL